MKYLISTGARVNLFREKSGIYDNQPNIDESYASIFLPSLTVFRPCTEIHVYIYNDLSPSQSIYVKFDTSIVQSKTVWDDASPVQGCMILWKYVEILTVELAFVYFFLYNYIVYAGLPPFHTVSVRY